MKAYYRMAFLLAVIMIWFLLPGLSQGEIAFVNPPPLMRPGKIIQISFSVTQAEKVDVMLLDDKGEAAAILLDDYSAKAGQNNFSWDGMLNGSPIGRGLYTLEISTNSAKASYSFTIGLESPILGNLSLSNDHLTPGMDWLIYATANQRGILTAAIENGEEEIILYHATVEAGEAVIPWDGTVNGSLLSPGIYTLMLYLTDDTGFSSNGQYVDVQVEAASQDMGENDIGAAGEIIAAPSKVAEISPAWFSPYPANQGEKSYWTLPMDLSDEAAVWEVLMQPITVLKGEQRKAYKLRAQPDDDADAVGEITYDSQGVRVLETFDNGWSLVEAYSSSFAHSKVEVWGEMVQGYVRTDMLQTKKPSSKYGLIIDKLTQRIYVFADGKLLTDLLISTGLPNEDQPYNETQAGEYLIVSRVGQFPSGNMICDMGLRFNNGNYIHQVPYVIASDGSKYFGYTEPKLGLKASHGCVRVQRKKNPDGVNMAWLWDNLDLNTKVLIWEDYKGRQITIPSDDMPLYYNPDGGSYYHSVENCPDVKEKYLPLTAFSFGELDDSSYNKLDPCPACAPAMRLAQIEAINVAHTK